MLTRVHTILFTEACPLACRYCYLKDHGSYGTCPPLKKEEIFNQIAKYDREDIDVNSRLLLTGGEPFLFPELIKEIMDMYGDRFQYMFNTSGYLLTEEMIRYLSTFKNVSFVLSVDGGERLTNYLRPTQDTKYGVGYFKQFKKILPTLLYYFPKTPFRIIVNPRYVDLLFNQYLEAEKLGFKYFTLILDFETRPAFVCNGQKAWSDNDTKMLQEQMNLIAEQIILGFQQGVSKPRVVEIDQAVKFLLDNKPFSVDNFPCQIFAGRTMLSVQSAKQTGHCMGAAFPDLEDLRVAINKSYEKTNGKCPEDEECPAFEYCAIKACPKNSLDYAGDFFRTEKLECAVNKVAFQTALMVLSICNEDCKDAPLYLKYIHQFKSLRKE